MYTRRAPVKFDVAGGIRHQAPSFDVCATFIYTGQAMFNRQVGNFHTVIHYEGVMYNHQRIDTSLRRLENTVEVRFRVRVPREIAA